MQIAILVDDNGTGLFRQAVTTFVQQTIDRADISIARIVGQPLVLAPFGTSAAGLAAAVASLGAAPATPDGGQLLSGIDEAARQMVRMETSRPVILVLTVGGEEHSGLESRVVLDRIRASGAALHVIVDASPDERQRGRIGRPADLLGPNLHLAEVLGEGPRQSGGSRHETMATGGVVTGIREVLTILRNQYAVTYLLPPGATPTGRLEVSAARPDVAVRAPSGVPTAR
jgi:hypothetical protein